MKLNNREKVLWLHSPKYGRRVVDRRWPINQGALSRGEKVWVVNPEKWTVAPADILEITKTYGFKIDAGEVTLQEQYQERIIDLHSQAKMSAHAIHLKKQGISVPTPSVFQHNDLHRAAHCWSCKDPLDSNDEMACVICRWLLCDCGACGCGYKRQGAI
jgi:hypothetical protein